jgi:hypothetical protein
MSLKYIRNLPCGIVFLQPSKTGRGVRVAEGARLESVYRGNSIAGSNPALSAKNKQMPA